MPNVIFRIVCKTIRNTTQKAVSQAQNVIIEKILDTKFSDSRYINELFLYYWS